MVCTTGRGVKINHTEDTKASTSGRKYDRLPTHKVDKVQKALKPNSLELQALVKDPIPEALQLAEVVLSAWHV